MEEEIILYECINPVMILNSFTMMTYSLSVKFRYEYISFSPLGFIEVLLVTLQA